MNKKYLISTLISLAFIAIQACDTPESLDKYHNQVFIKLYGGIESEEAYDFVQLNDGGYAIVGSTTSYGAGDSDVFLVRTDNNGNVLWSTNIGGEANEIGKSITLGTDGNSLIICGDIFEGDGFDLNTDPRDILLVKTDLNGNEIASNVIGVSGRNEYGQEVIHSNTGGYTVLGNNESDALYLFEVDESLQKKPGLGSDNYAIQGGENIGRNVTAYNDFYLCFGTVRVVPDSSENFFLYLIDINSTTISTIKQFGGGANERAVDMTPVSGGYLLSGYQINGNNSIPYLVKVRENFDAGNAVIWQRRIEGLQGSSQPRAVIETNDGGYLVLLSTLVSPFGNEIGLLKLNFDGSVAWTNYFGSQNNDIERGGNIIQLNDDYYVMCSTIRFDEKNNEDVYKMGLIKTNPSGQLEPVSE